MAAAAAAKPAAKPAAVKVMFKAVGGAPIMKKNGFNVNPKETFGKVASFLRKMLKLGDEADLFVYVNSSFIPSAHQSVGDLHRNFQVSGQLQLFYSLTKAWA